MNRKLRKLLKGAVQDALGGTKAPQVAGTFPFTGVQGVSSATLGQKLVGSTVPLDQSASSVPGMTLALRGGESPYVVGAEVGGGLDMTMEKALRKRAKKVNKKAQKRAIKPLLKARRDPLAAIARLELLARQLRPQHPARLRAAGVVLKAKMRAEAEAATGDSLRKAVGAVDPVEVVAALSEVEQALGISSSAAPFMPPRIDARQQLRQIMAGTAPDQSLADAQDSQSLTWYRSPASALGQALKSSGMVEELAAAEAEVINAEASGNGHALSAAQERLTLARLKAAHRVTEPN